MTRGCILLLCVASVLPGCSSPPAQDKISTPQTSLPVTGDTIVVGSIGDARTLVPILASDSSSGDVCGLLFNGLVKYNRAIELVGDLAEGWEVQDDGLTILFHLKHNVRWHDGRPFTAEDVAFTYQKLIDPAVRTPYSGDFERVKALTVIDPWTVRVAYKEPFAPGLASWGMAILPKHLLEKEDLNQTAFARNPIGTGPYRFKRWKTAERIDLEANPDYFEHRPYIDRYLYRIIPDQSTLFLELETQGVDETGLTPLQYRRQTENPFFEKTFQKFRYPSFGYTYLGYNLSDPRFSDKRVRQALNHAINKQEIIDGVLMGLGVECTGPFPSESWAYNPNVKPAPYDPQKARDLLAEAGWKDTNGDGIVDKQGVAFEFEIITNQGNEQRKNACEIIQRRLHEVGVSVKIKIVEWSAFISEFVDKRHFDAILLGWGLSRDPDCFDIWHSSKTRPGEFNFIGYKNEEVDRLLEEGRRVFDQAKRKEIYHRIHEILYDEQPYCFLYVPDALPIVHRRIQNVEVGPIGIGYNFIDWYVPASQQRYRHTVIEP